MLVVVGGLPATGKSTICRAFARDVGAIVLRIDSIEQAVVRAGLVDHPVGEAGYVIAYAFAEDQLASSALVVADCVNPLAVTRDAWRDVAARAHVAVVEVEVVCTNPNEHRERAVTRTADIPGLVLPRWDEIVHRTYEPWDREHITIDTAGRTVAECVADLRSATALT